MSRTKRWNASRCFFLLLLSKEWRAFLSACLSHLDLLSQNDERGRYSVMGQFPDQLRCNKQISNGPRGQGRAHRAVVMIWTDERGAPAAAARRRFAMSGEVGAVMPCSLNRALVKHAACGGGSEGGERRRPMTNGAP